jgi:hypothetical protein
MTTPSIQDHLAPLIGQAPWDVSLGHGSFLMLEFGRRVQDPPPSTRLHGEWHLWVMHCAWRLETAEGVLTACEDDRADIARIVPQLNHVSVTAIDVLAPSLETHIQFAGGIVLRLFPIYTEEYEHWQLFTPEGNILTVGPGTTWSYKNAGS